MTAVLMAVSIFLIGGGVGMVVGGVLAGRPIIIKEFKAAARKEAVKEKLSRALGAEPLAIWKVTTVHVQPKKQTKKSAPKIRKGAKKK